MIAEINNLNIKSKKKTILRYFNSQIDDLMRSESLKYIDIFAGCGGLSLGLHNAGWKGLFAIEKNEEAFKTLKHNLIEKRAHFEWVDWFPQKNIDIDTAIKMYKNEFKGLNGKVDLIAGGPPCQGFSTAGRRNENDERNNLIKSYIKFIKLIQPKIIFFENVKGFTLEFKRNEEKGKKYSSYVKNALDRAGYYVHGELVNFAEYGIPQKRTRFILVGIRKELPYSTKKMAKDFFINIKENRESFLAEKNLKINTTIGDAISDLLKSNGTEPSPDSKCFLAGLYAEAKSPYQTLMRSGIEGDSVDSHRFPNHRKDIIDKFKVILNTCRKNKDIDAETRKRFNIKKHTIIPLDKDDASPTITTLPDDYIHYSEPRILTVREYARIQSFPDWYEFQGKYTTGGKIRTKEVPRYSQIGNAIPPLFGEQSGVILMQMIKK